MYLKLSFTQNRLKTAVCFSVFNGTDAEYKSKGRLAKTKLTELNVCTGDRERR